MIKKIKLKSEDIENILEVLLMLAILFLSLRKGGFFAYDMNFISVIILSITTAICIFRFVKYKFKPEICSLFLAALSICYILPVALGSAVSVKDGIWETVKYLDLFAIFIVVNTSKSKEKYEYLLVFIGIAILIFGIDGIANRYLQRTLKFLGGGYLSSYLDRLSSFIQYANTCAILLCTSFLLSLKFLFKHIDDIKNDCTVQNVKKGKYMYIITAMLMLGILLTQSRFPAFIMALGIIIFLFKQKENIFFKAFTVLSQIFPVIVASNVIYSFIYGETIYIYLVAILLIPLLIIIYNIILSKVIMNVKIWYMQDRKIKGKKNGLVLITFCAFIMTYIVLGFNIKTGISICANDKNLNVIRRFSTNKNEHMQNIELNVSKKTEDAEYTVSIYEQRLDNTEVLVARFDDFSSNGDSHKIVLNPDENFKKYILKANVKKGKIRLNSLKLNGESITLNYLLFPSEIIFRFKDELLGSISSNVRLEYIKDSLKIFKTSPVIGRGGEAFRYLYKDVQTGKYTSTEAHSSFMQILIESGILGFIFIVLFIVYIIFKTKMSENKIIFLLFTVHSIFELNFSFTISVIFFAILAGSLEFQKKEKLEK